MAGSAIAALMGRHPLAAIKYLDRPGCCPEIDLLADQAVRHRVQEARIFDVIVGGDAGKAPFGELVIVGR